MEVSAIFLIILGASGAVITEDYRKATLLLWLCGVGVGACYLVTGMEYLAVLQWALATLLGVSQIFHSALFPQRRAARDLSNTLAVFTAIIVTVGVVASNWEFISAAFLFNQEWRRVSGLEVLKSHLIIFELLALMLCLTWIGVCCLVRENTE